MQTWIHYLLIFAIAFAATIAFVPLVRRFAKAHGIVDEPGPRRVNRRPVPRLGGVAMFGGLLVAVIVVSSFGIAGVGGGATFAVRVTPKERFKKSRATPLAWRFCATC